MSSTGLTMKQQDFLVCWAHFRCMCPFRPADSDLSVLLEEFAKNCQELHRITAVQIRMSRIGTLP